jgi:hypothetical protein
MTRQRLRSSRSTISPLAGGPAALREERRTGRLARQRVRGANTVACRRADGPGPFNYRESQQCNSQETVFLTPAIVPSRSHCDRLTNPQRALFYQTPERTCVHPHQPDRRCATVIFLSCSCEAFWRSARDRLG